MPAWARIAELDTQAHRLQESLSEKEDLDRQQHRGDLLDAELTSARTEYDTLKKSLSEIQSSAAFRGERLEGIRSRHCASASELTESAAECHGGPAVFTVGFDRVAGGPIRHPSHEYRARGNAAAPSRLLRVETSAPQANAMYSLRRPYPGAWAPLLIAIWCAAIAVAPRPR